MAGAAILKNLKTPYLGRSNSDFDEIWHDDAVRISWHVRLLKMLKSKVVAAAIFLKSKNRDISTAVRFDTMTQFDAVDRFDR